MCTCLTTSSPSHLEDILVHTQGNLRRINKGGGIAGYFLWDNYMVLVNNNIKQGNHNLGLGSNKWSTERKREGRRERGGGGGGGTTIKTRQDNSYSHVIGFRTQSKQHTQPQIFTLNINRHMHLNSGFTESLVCGFHVNSKPTYNAWHTRVVTWQL